MALQKKLLYICFIIICITLQSCTPIKLSLSKERIDNLDYQCRGGRVNSCEQLVEFYQLEASKVEGRQKNSLLKKSVKYLKIACEYGFFGSCYILAEYYEIGYVVKQNFEKASKLYIKACHEGYGINNSCKKSIKGVK
ncbi:MAG: tetratricopeptide repeat protein [Cellvibrionaceae bacterium]